VPVAGQSHDDKGHDLRIRVRTYSVPRTRLAGPTSPPKPRLIPAGTTPECTSMADTRAPWRAVKRYHTAAEVAEVADLWSGLMKTRPTANMPRWGK
jgi:hypothetical protein